LLIFKDRTRAILPESAFIEKDFGNGSAEGGSRLRSRRRPPALWWKDAVLVRKGCRDSHRDGSLAFMLPNTLDNTSFWLLAACVFSSPNLESPVARWWLSDNAAFPLNHFSEPVHLPNLYDPAKGYKS
jgi:hypothetical protein